MAKQPENYNRAWTEAQEKHLKELAKENTPTRVMGVKLGRTPSSIYKKASELGVSLKLVNQVPFHRKKPAC
ncbi:hypothetical protein [Phyllobacterium endophyticum]|uniref:hypothetical protein n=1 Tax=Phyllobacterium endophyticum TaxID=1149773 RepID=UPI0011CCAE62|nr:hypothetical protein [Phyllobacterium endophyticum]TXR49557.1 hypothetical protein FVA77_09650 [Phyllobacterium endophyticum]